MTVKRITTFGCHPILLIKKMAAISGVTILKEEKWTYSGKEYPYKVVVQINEGLFMEALDPIFAQATNESLLPNVDTFFVSTTVSRTWSSVSNPIKLEAAESDKGKTGTLQSGGYGERCYIRSATDIVFDKIALSALVTPYPQSSGMNDVGLFGYSAADAVGVMLAGEAPSSGATFSVAPGSPGYASYQEGAGVGAYSMKGFQCVAWPSGVTVPFIVCHGNVQKNVTFPSIYGLHTDVSPAQKGVALVATSYYPKLLLVSGTVFRVATSVSGDELVNPSDWNALPIFGSLIANDAGLFFLNGPGASYTGVLGITSIDTSFGGGMTGVFPAVWKSYRYSCYTGAQEGEGVKVLGDEGSPTNFPTMNVFATIPPISSDSVTGGPVCARILAYSSSEIRGAIRGILSSPTAVSMGTSGRVSGAKYSVQLPGRMIQVG